MKYMKKFLIITCLTLTVFSHAVHAQERPYSFGSEIDFNYRYLWNGLSFNEGFLMQPYEWFTYKGFTFGLWQSIVLYDPDNEEGLKEFDLIFDYSIPFEYLNLRVGYAHYFYPFSNSPSTGEVLLSADYSLFESLFFVSSHSIDVVEYSGAYYGDAGLEYRYNINDSVTLTLGSRIGWANAEFNNVYANSSSFALNNIQFSAEVLWYLNEFWYLRAHGELYVTLDSGIRRNNSPNIPINFGLASGVEF